MKVPKIIHYCWFGGKRMPGNARRCIASWKKYCPDYEIRRWDESCFDLSGFDYAREAYEAGKYAFTTDFVRLKVLEEYGGFYMDTDVELMRPLEGLLPDDAEGYIGFERKMRGGEVVYEASTGIGMCCVPHHPAVQAMLREYDGTHFLLPDGRMDLTPCPVRNTQALERLGLVPDNRLQTVAGLRVLPCDYLCPKDYQTHRVWITENTHSIHHYAMSWKSKRERLYYMYQRGIGYIKRYSLGRGIIKVKKRMSTLLKAKKGR